MDTTSLGEHTKTQADEELDKTVAGIQQCIEAISKIVIDRCIGSEGYDEGFYVFLRDLLTHQIEARDELERLRSGG